MDEQFFYPNSLSGYENFFIIKHSKNGKIKKKDSFYWKALQYT